jgi:hypothetical protein
MTPAQTIWTALIAAQAVVLSPLVIYLVKRILDMAVSPRISAALAEIQNSINAIPAMVATAVANANAAAVQDQADNEAAVQAMADSLKQAVGS